MFVIFTMAQLFRSSFQVLLFFPMFMVHVVSFLESMVALIDTGEQTRPFLLLWSLKTQRARRTKVEVLWSCIQPGVAENIAPVGGPGSHWPHRQLTTADWSHLCHTSITLCLSQSVKRTILHPAVVSRGNPFNNDIISWASNGCNILCYARVYLAQQIFTWQASHYLPVRDQWRPLHEHEYTLVST